MSDWIPRPIMDEDTIDLAALRFVFREAEIRVREVGPDDMPSAVQPEMDRDMDRRATRAAGAMAAEGCVRFDGEKVATSPDRSVKQRLYSMYALHPDTAEQIIQALEALMESVGPRYRIPTRARHYTAKTKRNDGPKQAPEGE